MSAVLPILLMLAVAAGIAWPFVKKRFAPEPEAVAVGADGEGFGAAARPREELCPSCATMNPPGARKCVECGSQMPVSDFGLLFEGTHKEDLMREGIQSGLLMVGMIVAMSLASFLPTAGKLAILLATIGALGYRFLKVIQD